jgi:hypothetical protein
MSILAVMYYSLAVQVCFAYIIPMARMGKIPEEQLKLPYKPFAVMGALDAVAGIMQVFAVTYLPGPLVILLVKISTCYNFGFDSLLCCFCCCLHDSNNQLFPSVWSFLNISLTPSTICTSIWELWLWR